MRFRQPLLVVLPFELIMAGLGFAQNDPLSRQVAQAGTRIDAVITQARRTGNVTPMLPELESVRQELERTHEELLKSNRKDDAALAILRAGDCLRMSNRMEEALIRYQQASQDLGASGSLELRAKVWLGVERVQRLGMHNHQAAADAIHEGLLVVGKSEDLWAIRVDLIGELAELEKSDGEMARALFWIESAISESKQHGDDERLWLNTYSRSNIHFSLADAKRETYVNLPCDTNLTWPGCKQLAGEVRSHLSQALNDTVQALEITRKLGHDAFAQSIASETASIEKERQAFEVLVAAKQAAYLAHQAEPANSRDALGPFLATKEGKLIPADLLGPVLPESDSLANESLERIRRALAEEQRPQSFSWRRRFLEGELAEFDHDIPKALTAYREAAEMVRSERKTVSDETLRGSFLAEKLQLYERLVLNLLKNQQYAEAFHWLEQSRARAMMDMLETISVQFQKPEERSAYADWVTARAKADAVSKPGGHTTEEGETVEDVLQRIRKQTPKLLELGESQPVSLQRMQSVLAATPCDLVYFVLHQGRVVLWHIGPTRTSARAYFAPAALLQSLAQRVIMSASSREFDQQAAEHLYFYLAEPAMDLMETTHLIVVPPPELNGLPFQLLFDSKKHEFFGEQIALSYAPSASLAASLKPARALGRGNILLMVGPGLESAGNEVEKIASKFPQHKVIFENAASFETLMTEAKGRNAIHLAAHGHYDPVTPMLSYVELASGPQREARTTAAQLLALPLQDVSVVTLGACSVGQARTDASNEMYGLVRSLLFAGAQSLVLPLWDVPDKAAAFWFEKFYANAATHDLPEAARLANVAARQHPVFGSHPRFWGGYQFIGH